MTRRERIRRRNRWDYRVQMRVSSGLLLATRRVKICIRRRLGPTGYALKNGWWLRLSRMATNLLEGRS